VVVLDSHVLYWWTHAPRRLSADASAACEHIAAGGGAVSSISIWELGIKVRRGELDLGLSMEEYTARLMRVSGLVIVPVSAEIWLANLALPWEHRDPADRTIVATAKLHGARLVTKDRVLHRLEPQLALW